MKIDNNFYRTVLANYKAANKSEYSAYICNTSNEFHSAWNLGESRKQIIEHADLFIKERDLSSNVSTHKYKQGDPYMVLFYDFSTIGARNLRTMFLEWACENVKS